MEKVLIVTGTPTEYTDAILDAISCAGGGIVGNYTHCAFTNVGQGRFKPSVDANPQTGDKLVINRVEETRIETFCNREDAKAVVDAIREAHPYEEAVIYVLPLLDVDAL